MSNTSKSGETSSTTPNNSVDSPTPDSLSNNATCSSGTQNQLKKKSVTNPTAPPVDTNDDAAGTSQTGDRIISCNVALVENETRIDLIQHSVTTLAVDQLPSSGNLNTNNETANIQNNSEIPARNFQSAVFNPQRDNLLKSYRCYRAFCGQTNSEMEIISSPRISTAGIIPPPVAGAPPSYSAVMQFSTAEEPWTVPGRRPVCVQPSPAFIAPIPPPTYAEVQGFQIERPMLVTSVEQVVWGPEPLTIVCPRCSHIVVTSTHSQRSNITHFLALALCLCGCWPCCLLPYCMDSCRNTYHTCPICNQFVGMYRPW